MLEIYTQQQPLSSFLKETIFGRFLLNENFLNTTKMWVRTLQNFILQNSIVEFNKFNFHLRSCQISRHFLHCLLISLSRNSHWLLLTFNNCTCDVWLSWVMRCYSKYFFSIFIYALWGVELRCIPSSFLQEIGNDATAWSLLGKLM
jgi:hypothetical protein